METLQNTQRKPCIVANWKMHGSISFVQNWIASWLALNTSEDRLGNSRLSDQLDIVLCPPVVYLPYFESSFLQLGAQNVYFGEQGAYTGELAPSMLKEAGCRYVIVGHSERRALFGETDEWIARKFKAVYDDQLIPILCVGETRAEREANNTLSVIRRQLEAVLSVVHLNCFSRAMIAYEPVWAIGTGLSATPEQAEEVQAAIREEIQKRDSKMASRVRLLYGGSVKASNAAALFAKPNIDGALVGGASLEPNEFFNICKCIKGIF